MSARSSAREPRVRKLILLARSLHRGGMERQVVETARALTDLGWSVNVVLFYGEGEFLERLDEFGIPWISLRKRSRWHLVGPIVRLVRVVRAQRPEFLYSFLVEPNIMGTLVKQLIRPTKVVWGVRVSDLDLSQHERFWRWSFGISRRLSRFADLIISNSTSGARHHVRIGYPSAKLVVVNNGIDVESFRPDRDQNRRMRSSWGVDREQLVGVVAGLRPMKDHETFLRSAALIEDHDVGFVLIGSGPEERFDELRALINNLGIASRVRWAGDQRDMPAVMNALDVLCLPSSDGEGFPNVLAEAMACGTPCVTTDVGDSRELVEGIGIVVPPAQPQLLATGIRSALEIVRDEEFIARSRARIVDRYSTATMAERTAAALESIS